MSKRHAHAKLMFLWSYVLVVSARRGCFETFRELYSPNSQGLWSWTLLRGLAAPPKTSSCKNSAGFPGKFKFFILIPEHKLYNNGWTRRNLDRLLVQFFLIVLYHLAAKFLKENLKEKKSATVMMEVMMNTYNLQSLSFIGTGNCCLGNWCLLLIIVCFKGPFFQNYQIKHFYYFRANWKESVACIREVLLIFLSVIWVSNSLSFNNIFWK